MLHNARRNWTTKIWANLSKKNQPFFCNAKGTYPRDAVPSKTRLHAEIREYLEWLTSTTETKILKDPFSATARSLECRVIQKNKWGTHNVYVESRISSPQLPTNISAVQRQRRNNILGRRHIISLDFSTPVGDHLWRTTNKLLPPETRSSSYTFREHSNVYSSFFHPVNKKKKTPTKRRENTLNALTTFSH